MPNGTALLLHAFAKRRGLRVRSCFEVYLDPADPATTVVSLAHRNRRYRLMTSVTKIVLSVKVEVPVFFSVGVPHPTLITRSPILRTVPAGSAQIFASSGFEDQVREWLKVRQRFSSIRSLALRPGESLHVARNESILVVLSDRDIEQSLETFASFLDSISKETNHETAQFFLPREFADLEPLARDWVIQDDVDRIQALENASAEEREKLRSVIAPRLRDIDHYLEKLDPREPLADEAIRLQALGELGAELTAYDRS